MNMGNGRMGGILVLVTLLAGLVINAAETSKVKNKFREFVSVRDFGAVGDGVTDDTAAIQAALNAAKGADNTGAGRSVFSLYFPSVSNGFYKITDTLVIDGTHGLVIYGDGALTKRGANNATIRWYGTKSKPVFQVKGGTGIPSNPNFYITIRDLTISGYRTRLPRKGKMPVDLALSGIHFGNLKGENDNTMCRRAIVENVQISNCRFGIWSGNPERKNTDHAAVLITGCFTSNAQAGICWGTGNAIVSVISSDFYNGWAGDSFPVDAYSTPIGANIHLRSGYMDLVSYTSAGKPTTADIFQQSGRISIINAWSDVFGYFFYQAGTSRSRNGYQVGQITGVRHYAGSMNEQNTPNSMRIVAPGTFVSSCTVYGNIEVVSGLSGRPIFAGINFIREGATFIGSGVDTQRSLTVLGNAGNYAQILLGGADSGVPLKHKGASGPSTTPQILSMGRNPCLFQVLDAAFSGTGLGFYTRTDDANASNSLIMNGYLAKGGIKPIQTKKMVWMIKLGGVNGLNVSGFDPKGADKVISFSSFINFGGFKSTPVNGLRSEVTFQPPFRKAPPSFNSGNYWRGTIYFDTSKNKLRLNVGEKNWIDLN